MNGKILHSTILFGAAGILGLSILLVAFTAAIPAALAQATVYYGDTIDGELSRSQSSFQYRIYANSGDMLVVRMTGYDGVDAYLELMDTRGRTLVTDDDSAGGTNSLITYSVPASGYYTILAHSYRYQTVGDFKLQIGVPLEQWLYGRISRAGSNPTYIFYGSQNNSVTITMLKDSSSLDPYLWLSDPTGTSVAKDDDSAGNANSRISSYRLRSSGVYEIVAGSYNNASTGDFRLLVQMGR